MRKTAHELARIVPSDITPHDKYVSRRALLAGGVGLAAGGVDIEMDVLVGVLGFEVEDLGHDQVRDLVVDLLTQEHDAFLHQQRVDVERAFTTS